MRLFCFVYISGPQLSHILLQPNIIVVRISDEGEGAHSAVVAVYAGISPMLCGSGIYSAAGSVISAGVLPLDAVSARARASSA
jgi:hypothetical protein